MKKRKSHRKYTIASKVLQLDHYEYLPHVAVTLEMLAMGESQAKVPFTCNVCQGV